MGDAVSGENPCLACGACCAAFRVDFHPSEMAGGAFAYGAGVPPALALSLNPRLMRMGRAIARGPLWWLGPLCGIIIIASPLPDEIGLFMMGLSRIRMIWFIPLAFIVNAGGIFLVVLTSQYLS